MVKTVKTIKFQLETVVLLLSSVLPSHPAALV